MSNIKEPVVAEVLNDTRLVINIGRDMNVEVGQRFLVYSESEHDLFDPVTFQSLGKFQDIKGVGKVTDVGDNTADIEWDTDQSYPAKNTGQNSWLEDLQAENLAKRDVKAFKEPSAGDKIKRL